MTRAGLAAAVCVAVSAAAARGAEPADSPDFFEKRIRPLLVENCLKCHGDLKGKEPKGSLRADSRSGLLKGGDNGPAIVPGDPDKSRLIEAVRFKNPDLQMPPKGKLPDAAIADLAAWVKAGAVWPADAAATTAAVKTFDLEKRKREHWAWQPVRPGTLPDVKDVTWPRGPVDRFILAKLEEKCVKPASPADRRVWIRRVTFDLTGLPPTPAEIEAFLADSSLNAEAVVVDRLLASPHFGERWGRHWLDLVRYAETRGHEFDAVIPQAHQYRDYVIRALNADVSYDRLVQEHIAGDLLPEPRKHLSQGFNESIIGTGFWFLGEEIHSPVDVRQDQADRFDNRIDVLTKAFLGLTVACARCHDHKFDAIGTKDYYALYGIVESSGYRQVRFDTLACNRKIAAELDELSDRSGKDLAATLAREAGQEIRQALASAQVSMPRSLPSGADIVIDYAACRAHEWIPDDASFGTRPRRVGDLIVVDGRVQFAATASAVYDRAWDVLAVPPGTEADHGALGKRVRAGRSIRTPAFKVAGGKVQYLVRGNGTAYAAVDQHTLIAGPLHAALVLDLPPAVDFHWVTHDLTAYQGHYAHVEYTAAKDSDFAVAMVVQGPTPPPPATQDAKSTAEEITALVERLKTGPPATARDARLANALLQATDGNANKVAADYVAARERIGKRIRPESRLAPAAWEGTGVDERVFIRGSPKAPGEAVPRRFLEAFDGTGPITSAPGSGRLELAGHLTAGNPLAARVAVNRVWHHLFGRGIVASVDNFGVLGERPTHPELLDFLADRFVRDGWSVKRLIRDVVLSSTYGMAATADAGSDKADPQDLLLHRMRLRRLEGEAIRDAMLAVSGRLDRTPYGPPVAIHLTPFLDGRGRPGTSGPVDGDGRRSIYLAVRRNFLNPLLLTFDTPIPFSTVGRRQVSNVPAQALILLNDPFVHDQARVWAKRVLDEPGTPTERVCGMYLAALGRPPTADELSACLAFIADQSARYKTTAGDVKPWADLAHTLFNTKEFIYMD